MVEPTFIAVGAVVFVVILVFILRSGSSSIEDNKPPRKDSRKQKPSNKQQKPKQKKNPKKNQNNPSPFEGIDWSDADTPQKEHQDVLEFLKGRDPTEIAKQHAPPKNNRRKGKKGKEEAVSENFIRESEHVSIDGFEVVSTKKTEDSLKKKKKNKKNLKKDETAPSTGTEEVKSKKKKKPFFKPAPGEKDQEVSNKGEKKKRAEQQANSGDEGVGEKRKRPEGEGVENPQGEKRDKREKRERQPKEGEEEKPRRPRPPSNRKPFPEEPPNVPSGKYEEADIGDILNAITQDFNTKPKVKPMVKPNSKRIASVFSKIPRNIVITILARLNARDLVALSKVNHYFLNVARKESLWKDLLWRDYGVRDANKYKSFRAAYSVEFKKKKPKKKEEIKEEKKVPVKKTVVEQPEETKKDSKEETKPVASEPWEEEPPFPAEDLDD